MSLFFEDNIQEMKDKANSSELLEILSQDPRGSSQVPRANERLINLRSWTHEGNARNARNRRW